MSQIICNSLTFSLLATIQLGISPGFASDLKAQSRENAPEYEKHFDPEQGFKPSQTSLAGIFRQLAGSLEHYGSLEPYLLHVKNESDRIARRYREQRGGEMSAFLPSYMTAEYIESIGGMWKSLSPNLGLDVLAKRSGEMMRLAIDGEDSNGTSLINFFNHHQEMIYEDMKKTDRQIGYEILIDHFDWLAREGESEMLSNMETELNFEEREQFAALLRKPRFKKNDFQAMEEFYSDPYNRLSEYGKALLSQRVWAGQRGEDVPESDAERYSSKLWDEYDSLFKKFDAELNENDAKELRRWITEVVQEVVMAAQIEFELGIQEWVIAEN